jgi:hypothetical protein
MSAADRQRRIRARRRNGEIVVPVAATNDVVAVLLDLGWLCEAESEDRRHIGDAISKLLRDLAMAQQKEP